MKILIKTTMGTNFWFWDSDNNCAGPHFGKRSCGNPFFVHYDISDMINGNRKNINKCSFVSENGPKIFTWDEMRTIILKCNKNPETGNPWEVICGVFC